MQAQFKMPDVLPYHAQWDITFGCNFRCTFCLTASGQRRPNELSTKNARTLIDKLYDEGIWFLKIMGGEPFFRRDTISLLEYAARKGMILSFSTNASLIDQDKASALADLRNSILYIQMSLYGENAARYHEVTGSAGNFERALKGLNSLVENGLDVCILTVATERNTSQIPAFYDIARRSGAKEFRLTTEIPLGRSARKRHIEMPSAPSILSTLIASLKTIKASMSASDPPVFLDARPLLGTF